MMLLPLSFFLTVLVIQTLGFASFKSPLDDSDYVHYYEEDIEVKPGPSIIMPSQDEFNKLPKCQQPCTKHLAKAFDVALKATNHYERYFGVCQKYNETLKCMSEVHECGNQMLFSVLTNGLKYMCEEQRDAFEATIECVDAASVQVIPECNTQCNTKAKLANWAMQSGILNGFQKGEKVPLLNPEMMRSLMRDGCALADCHLQCMKTKFNNRCEGNAGNLIAEMVVRPIAYIQQHQSFKMIANVMGLFIPQQCSFVVNEESLSKFRIDPKLDQDLRNLYKSRKEEIAQNSLLPDDQSEMPSILIPTNGPSPLDYDYEIAINQKNDDETKFESKENENDWNQVNETVTVLQESNEDEQNSTVLFESNEKIVTSDTVDENQSFRITDVEYICNLIAEEHKKFYSVCF